MPNLEMPNSPRLLKVAELAELLKVKPRTIYEMVAQNRIPYRKPPGSNILRFDLDEILAWTKASTNKWNWCSFILIVLYIAGTHGCTSGKENDNASLQPGR
jgi:excisionase family DNA binding protein